MLSLYADTVTHYFTACDKEQFWHDKARKYLVTTEYRRTLDSSNPNALVAISKGMRPVKLCSNKILQFLTGGWFPLTYFDLRMAVERLLLFQA